VQLSLTASELYCFEVPIGRNANFFKIGGKIGEGVIRFLSQTNSILLFQPRITVQNWIKIAAVWVFTDRLTERQTRCKWFY